ncbi:hypothetical protein JH06_3198 [Blastocystis sp. subtype 4]|uniref:hypothetical protein n=1 Tax=Blastocystis sp. subtype 4 TaxID=944170 RepID=UPI0007120672|nr:hypothetical protein JH06_3198 [Blastocystis sp. subtype 4]KNB42977.1 hypothetical protein JH06_3198 [Blastocystis sp. subtype 4]|eukprot:XP_014526420.1 hypothetical protein JH06_3198 [Blastocystis sp. subtype 4]
MGKFRIFMDLSEITQKPFISILVDTVDGKQSWYLNYRCPFSQLSCNSQKLTIQNIEDLQDGCAKVNIFFEGTGDVYLLSRLDGFDDPDTENVIREGIYLGKHSSEIVSTVYCHQLDNALYGFYAVAVTKNCVHTMTTKKFRIQSSKPEEVWRSHRMHVWVNQLSASQQQVGVKYRRFGGMTVLPETLSNIEISERGVLLSSLKDAKRVLAVKSRQEEISREDLVSYSLEWISLEVNNKQLRGIIFVLGEGDLYIFYTNKQIPVSSRDVVVLGQNVGYFDRESVVITADSVDTPGLSCYAVLGYGNQYFGPYSIEV